MKRTRILFAIFWASCLSGYPAAVFASDQSAAAGIVPRPAVVYVADFCVDGVRVEEKKFLGMERPGILSGLPHVLPGQGGETDPQKIKIILTDAIIKYLKGKGLRAEPVLGLRLDCSPEAVGAVKLSQESAPFPEDGWLVLGWLETIEEGNSAVQATVGFGAGAGNAQASVVVVDLAKDPGQPFLSLGSRSPARRMPGGAISLNPYVVGAKFVIERRKGMEKDIKKLGTTIAQSLVQYIEHGPPPAESASP